MLAFIDNWGDAKRAAASRSVALLPPDADPSDFDWTACAGADVLLRWRCTETTRERVHHLAMELVRAGAALVLSVETTGAPTERMSVYRRQQGVQHAA